MDTALEEGSSVEVDLVVRAREVVGAKKPSSARANALFAFDDRSGAQASGDGSGTN